MGNDSGDLSVQEREANVSAQLEELEALEAIYGEGYEAVRGSAASPQLRIRVSEIPLVSLHLRLPVGYPSRDFPELEIKAPGLGQAARRKLREDYTSGSPAADGGDDNDGDEKTVSSLTTTAGKFDKDEEGGGEPLEAELPAEEYVEIFHGQAFTDRKSTFQAHLARVSSESQVTWVRRRLMENGKVARATHNVAAWRVWDEARGVQLHDNDDDGKSSAAGSRLAHMLAITGAQNVVVVVSRWYGGIHLGPDRFKHINNAARELLVYCGATKADAEVGRGGAGGKTRVRRKRASGGGGS
ncbi:unnamed protein product [Ectocarpus sp. 6 AP-2014]